jgi:hypothetical protein
MKRYIAIGMLILGILALVSCAYQGSPFPRADWTNETWQQNVQANSGQWAQGASRWFLAGDPNRAEEASRQAPDTAAISTMQVRVPNFNSIKVNGPFQVQIFGSLEQNSVYVYGPNEEVRQIAVEVRGNTLYVNVAGDPAGTRKMGQVIVRIGIVNLLRLEQQGVGRIEGRQIRSTSLDIISSGSGAIYMAGNMNVKCIRASGSGNVNVWGAITPVLDIETNGSGCVNVCGNVGVRSIKHFGKGDINIIGANSDNLCIDAAGVGKIGIRGNVNVREIKAKDRTCVYICGSNSANLCAYLSGEAHVGVSGRANDLYVDASGNSRFWGRYLCTTNAYVRAKDSAHINVMASNKIFASAVNNSSIYFFGTPDLMSQFVSGNGTVIPIWFDNKRVCMAEAFAVYKDSYPVYRRTAHQKYHWKNKKVRGVKGEI